MSFKRVLDLFDLMDDPACNGNTIAKYIQSLGHRSVVTTTTVAGDAPGTSTDFLKIVIPGTAGKSAGGDAPTLGIIGRLGGIGARPERIGYVSDGDGALAACAAAAKLTLMAERGDTLPGDVIITTQICTHAPTRPHEPVAFMGSCVDQVCKNEYEVDAAMDAVLSLDTTKGNRIINLRGFAISPTIKEGWILRVSEDLLSIMSMTSGKLPATFPITQQDITPYGNDVYHMNSILQPAAATDAPCVGVAITTETQVPGCGTGVSHLDDIDEVVRFCIEVAKDFGAGKCRFYNAPEFEHLVALYGSMKQFQKPNQGIAL